MELFTNEDTKDLLPIIKHKEELLGSTTEIFTADIYDEISAIRALEVDYDDFLSWDIHTQAKLLAHLYLENMIEIIRKHDRITKDAADKRNKKK